MSPKTPRPAGGRPDRATGIVRQEQHSLNTRPNSKSQQQRKVERIFGAGRLDARKLGGKTLITAASIERLVTELPKRRP